MIKIAPSILSADFANLERDIHRIAAADYVHVDVMDGVFVPNISIGIPVVQSIRKVTDMFLDVHLMIIEPVRYVEQFCDAGADLVTVHVESDTEENIHAAIDKIHAKGKKAGIVRRPEIYGRYDAQGHRHPQAHRGEESCLRAGSGRRRGPRHLQDLHRGRCQCAGGWQRRLQGRGHSHPYRRTERLTCERRPFHAQTPLGHLSHAFL